MENFSEIFLLNKKLMEVFAKKNNFSFKPTVNLDNKSLECEIAPIYDKNEKIYNFITGSYENHKIEIFNYEQAFHSGAYHQKEYFRYIFFTIGIKNSLPLTVFNAEERYLSRFPFQVSYFKTESNEFNKHFTIFMPEKKDEDKVIILEILSPDIMAKLINEAKFDEKKGQYRNIHIEFKKNNIFLYKTHDFKEKGRNTVNSEEEIQMLLDLTVSLAESAEK